MHRETIVGEFTQQAEGFGSSEATALGLPDASFDAAVSRFAIWRAGPARPSRQKRSCL